MKKLQGVIAAVLIMAELGFTARAQTLFESATVSDDLPPEPQLLEPGMAPVNGTFFMLSDFQDDSAPPPYPCNVFPNAPTYATRAGGIYIVDNSEARPELFQAVDNVDLATLAIWGHVETLLDNIEQIRLQSSARLSQSSQLMTTSSLDPGVPGDGEGGTNEWTPEIGYSAPVYGSNDLWLQIEGVSNAVNQVYITVHGTMADVQYEILSREALADNNGWTSEGVIAGQEGETPTTILIGTRTNHLFFCCRSWQDTDGSGLPDWWQLQYFGTLGTDPYGDPDNDGWNNLQEYQNGTNPTAFDTPPAPQGMVIRFDGTSGLVEVDWQASSGPVTGYSVERDDTEIQQYSVADPHFSETISTYTPYPQFFGPQVYANYRVQAHYPGGDSAWTEWKPVQTDVGPTYYFENGTSIFTVAGPQGFAYLAVNGVPTDTIAIRLSRINALAHRNFDDSSFDSSFSFPVTDFTNGLCRFPAEIASAPTDGYENSDYVWYAQTINENNTPSQPIELVYDRDLSRGDFGFAARPFIDGRLQLKQNLAFLLRVAHADRPLELYMNADDGPIWYSYSSNYVYASWNDPYKHAGYTYFDVRELAPFRDNYLFRNFVFSPEDGDSTGKLTNGPSWLNGSLELFYPSKYDFEGPATNGTVVPALLAPEDSRWMCDISVGESEESLGISHSGAVYSMATGLRNVYGLQYLSAKLAYSPFQEVVLQAGGSVTAVSNTMVYIYPEVEQPQLQTVDYYFTRMPLNIFGDSALTPMPGETEFSVTNTTPTMIAAFGDPYFKIAGWARQELLNGYPDKFAYLGQYFEGAYTMDANGEVTTNSAGVLSAYGNFFPTNPGPAALVTMPDLDTGQRGTGVVNVVKLQLDVNHDGVMDLSFGGPDNTSQARPFTFWVNNDYDAAGLYGDPDRDIDNGNRLFDYNYSDGIYGTGKPCIHSQRDLEDYARLWICGTPPLTNGNYQVSMSWGSISSGNPKIHLFQSVETNGDTLYLTDTNAAAAQAAIQTYVPGSATNIAYYIPGPGISIGTVAPDSGFTLPANYFANGTTKYLLFEGAGIGAGELRLTISQITPQGTNVLAKTSTWLDFRDVKDMYERVHIAGVTNAVPPNSFLSSGYQQLNWGDTSSDEETNIIVFVHGWRMGTWDYFNFSESMLKRLYWRGYRGRFITIRWDTLSKDDFRFASTLQSFTTYNSSEYRAWESAKGVSDYLTYLKQERFPNYNVNVCAHSMGNVVMAEALRLQLAAGQHNINNYVLMQAAVPASCYDTSFTNYAPLIEAEQQRGRTPNPYWGYPGAIGGAVNGNLANFHNTNDYALATGTLPIIGATVSWEANQIKYKPDTGFGYNTDGTNSWRGFTLMTDSREIMSFVARPRSKAVGAQPNVGGAILTAGQVDLKGNYGFDTDKSEHSAEFNWNIQRLNGFYRQLGISLGVFQPPTP